MHLRPLMIGLLVATPLFAQGPTPSADTVDIQRIDVVGEPLAKTVLGSAVTYITHEQILNLRPLQVTDVLTRVPGLFVKDYGGVGGLKTVSLRGGSASQSLVILDGFAWNAAQSGQADLQTVPASFLKSVVVERGPVGAVHGANAMTGAISMKLMAPDNAATVLVDGGSFNTWRASASGGTQLGTVRLGAGIETYSSDGSFPYSVTYDGQPIEVNRSNADVRSISGIVRADIGPLTSITAMGRTGDRGVPGAVVEGATTHPRARLDDADALIQATSIIAMFEPGGSTVQLFMNAGFRYLDQHYVDPNATYTGPGGLDERFVMRDGVASLFGTLSDRSVDLYHRFRLVVGYLDLRGTSLQPDLGGLAVRRHAGFSYDVDHIASEVLSLQLALRGDLYSDAGSAFNGLVGASVAATSSLKIIGSIGTGFRPPSFNELYFLNYGTRDLKPERSATVTVGSEWQMLPWLSWDASTYYTRFTDLIVSVPLSPVVTSARNVGAAMGVGFESTLQAQLASDLWAQWMYTLQDLRDATGRPGLDDTRIPYVPVEMIGMDVQWQPGAFRVGADWQYTSYRYAQPGSEITSVLAPYHLLGLQAAVQATGLHTTAEIMLRADNVFDQRYSVVRGFPMPGRTFRLSLRVGL